MIGNPGAERMEMPDIPCVGLHHKPRGQSLENLFCKLRPMDSISIQNH
jgi:hypothetical protein